MVKKNENITREFQIDYDAIETDHDHDFALPSLVSHDETSVDELISKPIQRPTTKYVLFANRYCIAAHIVELYDVIGRDPTLPGCAFYISFNHKVEQC